MNTPTTIIATAEPTTIELFLAINEIGEFMTSFDSRSDAITELMSNYGAEAVRTLTVKVTVDLPTPETVAVTVPAETKAPAQVAVS